MLHTTLNSIYAINTALRNVITLLLTVVCISATFAASNFFDHYMTTHYNINNGLPHNFVDDIYRDTNGFVWISLGGGGLVRFDGYDYIQYSPSSSTRPIAGDFVKNVVEDDFNRLWIATDNGLSMIDLTTLSSVMPVEIDSVYGVYENISIGSVYIDSQSQMWIRHDEGIDCIKTGDKGEVIGIDKLKYSQISQNNSTIVRDINVDGSVWTGINGQIMRLKSQGNGNISADNLPIALPADALITDIIAMKDIVWIATDKGLMRHTKDKSREKIYIHDELDPHSLTQDYVTSLAVSPEGYLLASTLNGINIYDTSIDGFIHVTSSQLDEALSSNFVNFILVEDKNIWVATESGGLDLFSPKNITTEFYTHETNNPMSLSPNPVNSIFEDQEGDLWIGVVEGGLYRRKLNAKNLERYTTANSGLHHNSVSAIAQDSKGRLWIGTWGGGIDVLNPEHPQSNLIRILDLGALGYIPYVGMLIHDPLNQGMWIGTSNRVYFYDYNEERIIEPFDPVENTLRGCIGGAIDSTQHLWTGTMDGLTEIDLKSRTHDDKWAIRKLNHKLNDPQSHVREKISYVYVDSHGILWVASDIHGLYRRIIDENGERFYNLTSAQGLIQNSAMGIAEDDKGRLWISTNKGLSCYFPDDERFVNYTRGDGLDTDIFYWNAASHSRSGNVYFGAVDGLLTVNSALTEKVEASHRVVFTRLLVDNQPVTNNMVVSPFDISVSQKIKLHERNKSFTIEFSALDYAHNPAYNYCYMLEGFDKQWVWLPHGVHFVTYTNLAPGKYRLLVSYQPYGNIPSDDIATLDIEVERYFYHTLWFALLIGTLVAIAAWTWARWRIRRLHEREIVLEKAVRERTAEISQQKQMLEERTMRIQELTVERLSFFTNLTHEFRTPITLIMGPVSRALKLTKEPAVINQLQYVERNAKYLLNLVNQLMDFRKIESGKMEIIRQNYHFKEFLNGIIDSFRTIASERGIRIEELVHIPHPEICFDKEAVRKLLINLLSNAIKYTPDNGCITIYAALLPQSCTSTSSEHLYLCVSDTGDGIAPEDIDKVFNQFYQGKSFMKYPNMQASSGIGLHLCKCIVEAYGGHISVKNNHVQGCRFRIVLPVPNFADESVATINDSIEAPIKEEPSNRRISVMIIEDNADMRGYIKSVLINRYDVLEAENGEMALKMLIDNNVDFIICDLMMPVMDGMEFAHKAKENFATSHIPILMLTARTSDETRIQSYRSGVDDYICKPFNEGLLLARIENILANKQRHQRQFAANYNTSELQLEETRDKKFLDQVLAVLKDNYTNSYFDIGSFAEALGVSRSVLNKKLQSLVGQSSNEFVRNYRLNIAYQMIIRNRDSRNLSISEIAYDVGFNDSKYFTRCFTKHYGTTPSALMANK